MTTKQLREYARAQCVELLHKERTHELSTRRIIEKIARFDGEGSLFFEHQVNSLLNRQTNALLEMARFRREVAQSGHPITIDSETSEEEEVEAARLALLTISLDNLYSLMENIRGEARNCMESFLVEARVEAQTSRARRAKSRKVDQRRECMRPFVEETASRFKSEGPAKIAARLLKRKDFKARFGASRRTIEADVAALVTGQE
jgi:hypothetical protein